MTKLRVRRFLCQADLDEIQETCGYGRSPSDHSGLAPVEDDEDSLEDDDEEFDFDSLDDV